MNFSHEANTGHHARVSSHDIWILLLLPSILSSSPLLHCDDSRLLKLSSKASSSSALLNDWPSTPWQRETLNIIQRHFALWTMRSVWDACMTLTDKTCSISLDNFVNASGCLYWNKSLMNLMADVMGIWLSPSDTRNCIISHRFEPFHNKNNNNNNFQYTMRFC